jgi:hypothetical protein
MQEACQHREERNMEIPVRSPILTSITRTRRGILLLLLFAAMMCPLSAQTLQRSVVALNLASALIEIARMVPAGARPTMPTGAFILGNENDGVMARVNRLIDLAAAAGSQRPAISKVMSLTAKAIGLAFMGAVIVVFINSHALATLHTAMERVVQALN